MMVNTSGSIYVPLYLQLSRGPAPTRRALLIP